MDDVPSLPRQFKAKVVGDKLERNWRNLQSKGDSHWYLAKAIWQTFGADFVLAAITIMISLICTHLLEPFLSAFLIGYASRTDASLWEGLVYVAIILGVCVIRFVNYKYHYWQVHLLYMQVNTAIRVLVYRKSLRVSNISQGNTSNLLNVDPGHLSDAVYDLHSLWSMPLSICLATFVLYQLLGWVSAVSVLLMFLMAPLNRWTINKLDDAMTEMMKFKDVRIKQLTEILQGIFIVKLFAWEENMKERIQLVRSQEVVYLKEFSLQLALLNFFVQIYSCVATAVTLALYALMGNHLGAEKIFPALVVFNNLTWSVLILPSLSTKLAESHVALVRLNTFLRKEELKKKKWVHCKNVEIEIQDGGFVHYEHDQNLHSDQIAPESSENVPPITEKFELRNLTFRVDSGKLVAIIGRVGSGKSSILRAFLGEMRKISGEVTINGTVCLVPQQPWIRNESFRENILFGLPYEKKRYEKTLRRCALSEDLLNFPAGDQTEIGEKGINLSGGQKQRVSLARALYADRDIYFLDDPFSAVDAHVGWHIFQECVLSGMKNKIRVLVTHQVHILPHVDNIYIFGNGKIIQSGTYESLIKEGYDFKQIMLEKETSSEIPDVNLKISSESIEDIFPPKEQFDNIGQEKTECDKNLSSQGRLTDDEEHVHGALDWNVVKTYILNLGGKKFAIFFFTNWILIETTQRAQALLLSFWSDGTFQPDPGMLFYLGIYFGSIVVSGIMSFIEFYLWFNVTLNCALRLHEQLLDSVLHAPLRFFHTTPTGRIINRFSKDQNNIEQDLPDNLNDCVGSLVSVLAVIITIAAVMPWMILGLIPVGIIYYFLLNYYRCTSRELGRLTSISQSPIFAQFSETIQGLETIRAYGNQSGIQKQCDNLTDKYVSCDFMSVASTYWLGVRVESLGAIVYVMACLVVVLNMYYKLFDLSLGFVGLLLTLSQSFTGNLNWFVRMVSTLEYKMPSVERVWEYINTPTESPLSGIPIPTGWPANGKIQFQGVSMKYRADGEFILKDITFTIQPKEKIGIVGRTGAGKSSLISVLFRLVEHCEGSITIDNVNISDITLRDLRQNLAIIPQDPILFSGTVRSNLDPFNQYQDIHIWQALENVHLKQFVETLSGKLESQIIDGGGNLSVGQRQLMCMGRALLRTTRILIMDEATASVDNHTDALIQQTIRNSFSNFTVLTIAHRINTIMDSDRIMVLDKGCLVEFDTPKNLQKNPQSIFRSLVRTYGGLES